MVLTLALPCHADGASDAAAAEQLFDEGRALMAAKSYEKACAKLEDSQRLDPGAGTLLNLAGCYEALGRTASAWVTYKEAEGAAERSGRDNWRRIAHEHAESLGRVLPQLSIVLPPENDIPGLVVERDGKPVDRAVWEGVPTDPGSHVIGARAPGRTAWSMRVDVAREGGRVLVTVPALVLARVAPSPLGPSADPRAAEASAAPARASTTQRTVGLVSLGAGLAAVSVGAIFGLLARGTYRDALENDCGGRRDACTLNGVDRVSTANTQAGVSTVLFVVGATASAAGIIVLLTAPSSHDPRRSVTIGVTPSLGGPSLNATGAF